MTKLSDVQNLYTEQMCLYVPKFSIYKADIMF